MCFCFCSVTPAGLYSNIDAGRATCCFMQTIDDDRGKASL